MSKITINRVPGYSNKYRKFQLILDNNFIADIKEGEIKTIEVEPGRHTLKAKIDWCQSNELDLNVEEGESKNLKITGTNPFLVFYYVTFGRKKYLNLENIH